ncbi:hypothetical protein Ahy_A07g032884 isoform A [Arachis hypogaea]|uniref:Uncharacterized protein n=1 Tax=Arachis hypogaea TaxID=3818 RepID=A0A445C7T2_ARAHY|nr:hypothetical protein Ahy_A07g032884 isoform A [Arachis hypogaea]
MVETEMNKQDKPIFIPSPVLSMKLSSTPSSDSYIKSVFSSQQHIKHIDAPEVELPPHELLLKSPLYYGWTLDIHVKPCATSQRHSAEHSIFLSKL